MMCCWLVFGHSLVWLILWKVRRKKQLYNHLSRLCEKNGLSVCVSCLPSAAAAGIFCAYSLLCALQILSPFSMPNTQIPPPSPLHLLDSELSPAVNSSMEGIVRRQASVRVALFVFSGVVLALGLCVGVNLAFWEGDRGRFWRSEAPNSLHFLVVGDWGRNGLYNQSRNAVQMGRIAEEVGIEFVISTGDNFYQTGLKGIQDPLFTASFSNIYTAASLQTTWFAVLGNHDYMGDALAQTSEEIRQRDPRWFCRKEFQLHRLLCGPSSEESCDSKLDFFFIDTTPFIDEYWEDNATVKFDWRGLAPRKEQLQRQLENLRGRLKESTATWKIVVGHHTIRSIGHHGDSHELLRQLLPILEDLEVDLYINGHDHNLQYIKRADSPVHFITSGGGSKAWSGLRPASEEEGVQFAYDGQGFLSVSVEPTILSFSFYSALGDLLFSSALTKQRPIQEAGYAFQLLSAMSWPRRVLPL